MIFYFSGTGNSRYVAEQIARATGDELVSINDKIKNRDYGTQECSDNIVFVAPVYAWRQPRVVADWIRRVEFSGAKKAWFILTCGSEIGNAAKYDRLLCEEKKLEYMGTAQIVMPENFITMFNAPEWPEAEQIIREAEPDIAKAARLIKESTAFAKERCNIVDRLMSGIVNPVFYKLFVKADPYYAAAARWKQLNTVEKVRVNQDIYAGGTIKMRKNITGKSFLFPMPVLILAAYDETGKPQCMNAAWGGVCGMTKISICVSPGHKTVKALLERGAFTVSMGDVANEVACDYVGVVSGNKEPDKFAKAGFTALKSENVDAPLIEQLKMALECKVASYDEESHVLIGEVVNISIDEAVLDSDGNIDVRKLNPIIYDSPNKDYYAFGEKVGKAYSDGHKIR